MNRESGLLLGSALIMAMGCWVSTAHAQAVPYQQMAPIDQYLMDETAEIDLARSAAPTAISANATILVLGRQGYQNAVSGSNGFVCWVARSWTAAFDWPEFWNPRVRAADCMNRQAARSIVPIVLLRSRMTMAGQPKAEILSAVKAAYQRGEVPAIESGAMDYMMSKASYLTDQGGHNMPHLMWLTAGMEPSDWGAGAEGSPIVAAPYWFFSSVEPSQLNGLQPIMVFLVGVPYWSDGTVRGTHDD